jgi:hypothetical protein
MLALALVSVVGVGGCYDSHRLIERARNAAIRARSEEVSLGYFRTCLPRDVNLGAPMEVEIELFVTTKRYRIPEIKQRIKSEMPRLRQGLLFAIRQTTAEEIADPRLTKLRERMWLVTKEVFVDPPIDSLGIRQVRFIPL